MRLYTVYDKLMKEFGPPFTSKNDDTAVRTCKNSILKGVPDIEDYSLFFVGEMDPVSGSVTGLDVIMEVPFVRGGSNGKTV